MCGIAGWFEFNEKGQRESLQSMAASLSHRGPDDEGFYTYDRAPGEVALAHRRLAILDLEGGHQPMQIKDGAITIVFNGEIYNFPELQKELRDKGHDVRLRSDTEIILHAYAEWGVECAAQLHGMFAFALFDREADLLLLCRDRFGKKPLFYYLDDNRLVFGSEIKALLAHPLIHASLDNHSIHQYMKYRYVPGPATLFSKIKKLPPSSTMIVRNGSLDIQKYYALPDHRGLVLKKAQDETAVVSQFGILLDEAVRKRMVCDVPFGAFLSGGLDSSSLVALMTQHSSHPIETFSVGFDQSQYSETKHAQVIADTFKTNHHELIVSAEELVDHLPKLISHRDAPVCEPSDIPMYLLSLEARKKVKMVLTGEGSDEVLGGYPKHVFEQLSDLYAYVPSLIRERLLVHLVDLLPYRFHRAKTATQALALEKIEERYPRWFGALNQVQVDKLMIENTEGRDISYPFAVTPDNSALRKLLFFDQTSWLPDNLLERGDRMTMAASLEARMPFLDHNLLEYVSALPDRFRVRGQTTKWILRKYARSLIPLEIIERPKVGFRVPVSDWFRGVLGNYLRNLILADDARSVEILNKEMIRQLLEEHINGRKNHEKLLWMLLNLELWCRHYLDERRVSDDRVNSRAML